MRVIGKLPGADFVMHQAFWIGVYPGIDGLARNHIMQTIKLFVEAKRK
jgi:hypothetical protein